MQNFLNQVSITYLISQVTVILTRKLAVVTLYSYFPALLDQTMSIACELVRTVKARVTIDLFHKERMLTGWI